MRPDFFDLNTAERLPIPKDVGNDNAPSPAGAVSPPPAPVSQTERQPRFVVEDFDTLQLQPAAWLVKGLIPRVGVQILVGPSMSGKSFLALYLAAAISQGRKVFDHKTVKAAGLYVASEDAAGVRLRMFGLRWQGGPLGGALRFVGQAPNLTDPEDVEALREMVEQQRADFQAAGHRLGFVVIDTLSASIPGADENSARDMSPVLAALQKLAQELDIAVLLVAHTGKDATKNVRGWSGTKANADGVILVEEADADGIRVITADKVKNGAAGQRFAFSLEVVPLGTDEDGDPITTCVVREEEAPAGSSRASKADSPDLILLKQAFNRLFPDRALPVPLPEAKGRKGVRRADLRREAFTMGFGPTKPDNKDHPDPGELKMATQRWEDARRKAFDRALDKLVTNGGYRREGDFVWDLSPPKPSPS